MIDSKQSFGFWGIRTSKDTEKGRTIWQTYLKNSLIRGHNKHYHTNTVRKTTQPYIRVGQTRILLVRLQKKLLTDEDVNTDMETTAYTKKQHRNESRIMCPSIKDGNSSIQEDNQFNQGNQPNKRHTFDSTF